jgi:hypothetical protein
VIDTAKSWFKEHSTLLYFLIAQAIGIGAAVLSMVSYMVNLEARVAILETRGSPHLNEINTRLTVLEKTTEANKEGLERVKDIMTRRLNINP